MTTHRGPQPLLPSPSLSFQGEPDDFYCLLCLVPCSALSLLVGEHTNHPRRRIEEAYETAPTDITREVAEFEHCVNHFAASIEQRAAENRTREAAIVERLDSVVEAIKSLHADRCELETQWADIGIRHEQDIQHQHSQLEALRKAGSSLRRATEEWIDLYELWLVRHRGGCTDKGGETAAPPLTPTLCRAASTDLEQVRGRLAQTLKSLDAGLDHFVAKHRCGGERRGQSAPSRPSETHDASCEADGHVGSSRTGMDRDSLHYWEQLLHQHRRGERQDEASAERRSAGVPLSNHHVFSRPPPSLNGEQCHRGEGTSPVSCGSTTADSDHLVDDFTQQPTKPTLWNANRNPAKSPSDSDEGPGASRPRAVPPPRRNSNEVITNLAAQPRVYRPSSSAAPPPRDKRGDDLSSSSSSSPLLRQYFHLRSCLQDALEMNQPAALVNSFVRCIRQLREEARAAGLGNDVDRAAAGDPEYTLLFGDV